MSKNYKIIVNPKPPDSDTINQHRDFDTLLSNYKVAKRKKGRLRVMYSSTAIAASILFLVAFFVLNRGSNTLQYEKAAQAYFASQDFIKPPIKDIQLPISQITVEASQGDTLNFGSGSQIIIPSRAFVDQNGQEISGEVDIQFREMHDFVDFFISGIPMHYDSNGVRYQLESAGMIEILGFQNGQKVELAQNKNIQVELVSRVQMPRVNTTPPKYNIYHLNVADRKWDYSSIDRIQLIAEENPSDQTFFDQLKSNFQAVINQIEQNNRSNLAALESLHPMPEEPIKPVEEQQGAPTIELDFLDDIQELDFYEGTQDKLEKIRATYNGVIFQIAPNSPPINLEQFGKTWQGARIQSINETEFEITLLGDEDSVVLRVIPVLGGDGFQAAMELYQTQLESYNQAIQVRNSRIQSKRDSLSQIKEALIEKEKLQFESSVQDMINEGRINPDEMGTFKIINRFTINKFGVWNCDRPVAPTADPSMIKLVDQNGRTIKGKTTFIANKKQNTVYQYLATNKTPISLMEDAESIIWVVDENNKLAILKTLGRQVTSSKDEIRLEVLSEEIVDEAGLREVLFF